MESFLAAIVSLIAGFVLGAVLIITSAEKRDENRVRDGWMAHGGKVFVIAPAKPATAAP
jgi:hypothetical protein